MTAKDAFPFGVLTIILIFIAIVGIIRQQSVLVFFVSIVTMIFIAFFTFIFYKEPTWETVYKEVAEERRQQQVRFEEWIRRIVRDEVVKQREVKKK